MGHIAHKVVRALKSVILRATGYYETQAEIASGRLQILGRLDKVADHLARQSERVGALAEQLNNSELSLARQSERVGALAEQLNNSEVSFAQIARKLENIEFIAQALHPKADGQLSQSHVRDLLIADRIEFQNAAARAVACSVKEETDRLDAYLVYHTGELRDEFRKHVRSLRNEMRRIGVLYTAIEMDAILLVEDYDLVVPTREAGLLTYLRRHGAGAIEPAVRAALRRHLRPGDVAVDAGANIGMHSMTMARAVGPEGRMIAFEPLPHLAAAISRSLTLNGLSGRSEVVQAALADGAGEVVIHAAAHSPISSIFALDGAEATPLTVPRTSLDAHVPPGGRVNLVKMDIEGAEPLAWAGMARVVAENPQLVIALEWSASHFARSGHSPTALMASIQAAGFSPWLLRDEAPDTPMAFDPREASNLDGGNLLLRREG